MDFSAQQQQQWTAQPQYNQQQQATTWSAAPQPSSYPHHQPTTLEEIRTLWIGDLQFWIDENYLNTCFAHTNEVLSIKIIRNKITGQPEGYGFVEFTTHAAAERILQTYNGTLMPGTELPFRLNWASFGIGERRPEAGPEHSIFVGDLAPDVTDYVLQETFRIQYPSVRGAKVVTDPNTGRSKGYGFVKFQDEMERNRAMSEMNGVYCSTRPMRISAATPKKATGGFQQPQQQYTAPKVYPATPTAYTTPAIQQVPAVEADINNTTIFIGGLDPNISEEELRQIFAQFGEILYVNIPLGKGCGFVQFAARPSAEEAIQRMNGATIGQQTIRVSWGKSMTTKQDQAGAWAQTADPNQWSAAAYYGYGQGYDPYAYAAGQDPALYAYGAYAGYGQYPQQVEGMQEMEGVGAVPVMEQKEEYDPMNIPDVDKLNAGYLSVHGSTMVGRPLWLKTSGLAQHA
ncbi:Polyadenylate-binding protein rbp47b' [Ranunculus cassubicifolius]